MIGSFKGEAIINREIEKSFFERIRNVYIETRDAYNDYHHKRKADDDEYFEAIYELATQLESVEDMIGRRDTDEVLKRVLGKKPSDFFNDGLDYDFSEQDRRHRELRKMLNSNELNYDEEFRKEAGKQIEAICKAHRVLIRNIHNLIAALDEE